MPSTLGIVVSGNLPKPVWGNNPVFVYGIYSVSDLSLIHI